MSDRSIDYRGNAYAADEFERQFNPRADNPDIGLQLEERSRLASSTRKNLAFTSDVSYGPSPRQTLDIFHGNPNRRGECADLLFFHGGYWRAGHGSENCFVAEAFVEAGANESFEWQRQTHLYADIARGAGCATDTVIEAGANHLGLLFDLRSATSDSTQAALTRMKI